MSELLHTTLLNRYYLAELIGQGGMADVYLAWDKKRMTNVAIKKLHHEKEGDARFGHLFAQEAELLRKLEHPGIVRIYEYIEQGDISFIVMDYIEGSNLKIAIQNHKKPYSTEEIFPILSSICTALNYAHQNNVLHCDIKPANILLHKDGRVLVSDFGIARWAGKKNKNQNLVSSGGTPRYMAPEQFSSIHLAPNTDVYALGVVLYELFSGGLVPFNGEDQNTPGSTLEARIQWEHKNLLPPPLTKFNPSISVVVTSAVNRALEKEPQNRYQTVMELLQAFEKIRTVGDGSKTVIMAKPAVPLPPMEKPVHPTHSRLLKKGPQLFCRSGDFQGQAITIPPGGITLGRSNTNQITLRESGISRKHAVIISARRGIYIRDENSLMGTLLNGRRLQPGVPELLQPGDIIQIGFQQVFEFRAG